MNDEVRRRRNNINYAIQLDAINRRRPGISRCGDRRVIRERHSLRKKAKKKGRETGRWEKVAAWRPVRRGKNDRALTRYKSHYDVNLLDPSPPTDFQPPGTVLGCRLWATSHANSDKVPLSPSRFLSVCLAYSIVLCLSYRLQRTADIPSSSLSAYPLYVTLFLSLPLCLSLSRYVTRCCVWRERQITSPSARNDMVIGTTMRSEN